MIIDRNEDGLVCIDGKPVVAYFEEFNASV
jgi:hypothetical protein